MDPMGYDFGAFNDLIDLIDLIAGCSMLYCAPRLAVTNVILESRCRKAIHIESRMDLGKVTLRQGLPILQ